ncbi:MAG TPA: hypothetical protein P5173_01905 [Bacilli bacterium]|nr:hypothetical protein [Bacilli bacterium]
MYSLKRNAKRLLLVLVAFALIFGLIGCGGTDEEPKEPTLQEKLETAVGSIVMENIATLSSNLVLPEKARGEYDIVWTISESEYAEIGTNRSGAPMIKISRPESTEGYKKFVITATISKDGATASREWEGYVKPLAEGVKVLTAAGVKAAEINASVLITGKVLIVCKSAGFWVVDETGAVYVYGAPGDVQPGDTVTVSGNKTVYYSLVEIEKPGITIDEEGDGTYPYAEIATVGTADDIFAFKSTDQENYGKVMTIEGYVVDDPQGAYTYGIQDFKSGNAVTVYNSCTNNDALDKLKEMKGQYVKATIIVYDYHSNGYWRVLAIASEIEAAEVPVLSDQEKVASTKEQLTAAFDGKTIYADIDLPKTNDFEGLTISWVSDKPEVLSAEGVKGTSPEIENVVKLTATITSGSLTETLEITINVFMLAKTSVKYALYTSDLGGDTVWVEGKIVALDVDGYFYLADETGVIYVRTKLTDDVAALGDSVKVIGKTSFYNNKNKQYTRQMAASSITKLETEVTPLAAIQTTISGFPALDVADGLLTDLGYAQIKGNSAYGKIIEITGYVQTRGTYGNIYLCETTEETSAGILYYYKSSYQNEIKELVGKLVKFTCVIYDASAGDGWRLGSCLSYEEVTTPIAFEPTPGAITIAEAIAAAKDTEVIVEGVVKYASVGNGIIVEDSTGTIFVYDKTLTGFVAGDIVSVSGKKGEYNSSPQIGTATVTRKGTSSYVYTYETNTLAEINAMSNADKTIFGKVFKVTGTLVASGNYVNIKFGDVTQNLYNDAFNLSILKPLVGQEVELLVVIYNYYAKGSVYNLFPIATTVRVITPGA